MTTRYKFEILIFS